MRIDEIIYKTLIAGDSYRTLLKGLWVTLQISLLSLLLGTLLGVAVCAMRTASPVCSVWSLGSFHLHDDLQPVDQLPGFQLL